MLALTYSETVGGGDVSYASGAMIASGFDLDTAVYVSLECDAPSRGDDPLTADAARRGWWGDAFADDGVVLGGYLWTLEHEPAIETTVGKGTKLAKEALAWLVADGHARAVDVRGELDGQEVVLYPAITGLDGRVVRPGPVRVAVGQ